VEDYFVLFTFYSTHLALAFENNLKSKNIFVKLMPVPRQISSSCGLAGKIEKKDLEQVKDICEEENIEYEEIYKIYENKVKDPEIL